MNTELAELDEPSDGQRLANRTGSLAESTKPVNPLRSLPKEWRKPVGFFWAIWKESLKDSLSLCTRLMIYIEAGLTLEEARVIFRKLSMPNRQAEITWADKLLAELAKEVDAVLARKKQINDMIERREQIKQTEPADVIRLRSWIADRFGKME